MRRDTVSGRYKCHYHRDPGAKPQGWYKAAHLPLRDTFEEAQADLDAYASKEGWQEWKGA